MTPLASRIVLGLFLLMLVAGVVWMATKPSRYQAVSGKIEFALVARSGPPALVLADERKSAEHRELPLETPRAFEMKSAYTVKDHGTGQTMLGFEMTEADSQRFHDWTGANIGRSMVVLYDRRVCMVANIADALQGSSLIPFGAANGQ